MTQAKTIMNDALQDLGVSSEIKPASEQQVEWARKELRGMLSEWRDIGIKIGPAEITKDSIDLQESNSCTQPITKNLAVRLAPSFSISPKPELIGQANKGMDFLYRNYRDLFNETRPLSSQLPRGQGAHNETYFNEGDRVGGQSGAGNIDTL